MSHLFLDSVSEPFILHVINLFFSTLFISQVKTYSLWWQGVYTLNRFKLARHEAHNFLFVIIVFFMIKPSTAYS